MSKVEDVLNQYVNALNDKQDVNNYEDLLSNEIENLAKILSIVEKVEFEEIEENKGIDRCITLIQKIIQETSKIYKKESILLDSKNFF